MYQSKKRSTSAEELNSQQNNRNGEVSSGAISPGRSSATGLVKTNHGIANGPDSREGMVDINHITIFENIMHELKNGGDDDDAIKKHAGGINYLDEEDMDKDKK
jgi:hypothetical protein